jgi:hypothetical protein
MLKWETACIGFKLVCCFKPAADLIGGGAREFVYDMDRLDFLNRELVGFDVDRYR